MTDTASTPPPQNDNAATASGTGAAGAMLRAARQQQGLHIAALAASIKVAPAKLEALEAGRYHELPDTTFVRALALTVCRVLKIDPTPVLAQLPGALSTGVWRVDGGLNTPFRERPGRVDPAVLAPWRHPVLWIVAALLVAAAAFVLVPSVPGIDRLAPPADAASAPVMPPGGATVVPLLPDGGVPAQADAASATPLLAGSAAPASASSAASLAATKVATALVVAPAGEAASAATSGDALILRAVQSTWVQAVDGTGQTLMARLVPAGETVSLTAKPPLRLRIGNASGTELGFRGQPVDLKAVARDNIANITLP